jgi:ribosomal-protein-alanine N-acetyltransferase
LIDPVETPRLVLAPLSVAAAAALLRGDRGKARSELGLAPAPEWPEQAFVEQVLPIHVRRVNEDPAAARWSVWTMALDGVVVGSASFKGGPDVRGVVEIGYGVAPAYRGRGVATEAVIALTELALADPGVRAVVATTDPHNLSSMRVLEKAGFVRTGKEGDLLAWRHVGRAVAHAS